MIIKTPPTGWMPIYVGDYLSDTMHLTTEQHGAYLLLIMAYWKGSKPLQENTLQQITRMDSRKWNIARPILAEFFTVADGVWTHKRIEKEIVISCEKYSAAVIRSRKGHVTKKLRAEQPDNVQ